MIIFGTGMYWKKDIVNGWGYCDHCDKYVKNKSYNGRKWGHIYFIPLIPSGPKVRVVAECKSCSNGLHLPENEVADVLNDMRQSSKRALAALNDGHATFSDIEGVETGCVAYLKDSVSMLFYLCAEDDVQMILSSLQENELTYEYHLVNGEVLEFQGQLDQAQASYKRAVECFPEDTYAMFALGSIHLMNNDYDNAKVVYEKALLYSEDKFPVLSVLLEVYGPLKDYHRLSETYEECFRLVPELAGDKKVYKAYKKACKKFGKQPVKY